MTNIYVHCFKIKYYKKDKILSVCGPGAVDNFMNQTYIDFYGKHYVEETSSETAPTEINIKLAVKDDFFDSLDLYYDELKAQIESQVGLKVESFSYVII